MQKERALRCVSTCVIMKPTSPKRSGGTANEDKVRWWWGRGGNLTVLLGQLYFSKISWARSSPPSVNIIIILLQLALGALVSWGTGRGRKTREGGGRLGDRQGVREEEKRERGVGGACDHAREDATHIRNQFSPSVLRFTPGGFFTWLAFYRHRCGSCEN